MQDNGHLYRALLPIGVGGVTIYCGQYSVQYDTLIGEIWRELQNLLEFTALSIKADQIDRPRLKPCR